MQGLVRGDFGECEGKLTRAAKLWETLNELWGSKPGPDTISIFSSGYEDHLQTPLQVPPFPSANQGVHQ